MSLCICSSPSVGPYFCLFQGEVISVSLCISVCFPFLCTSSHESPPVFPLPLGLCLALSPGVADSLSVSLCVCLWALVSAPLCSSTWRPSSAPDVRCGFGGAWPSVLPPLSHLSAPGNRHTATPSSERSFIPRGHPQGQGQGCAQAGSALKLFLAAFHSTERIDVLAPVSYLPVFLEEWVRG